MEEHQVKRIVNEEIQRLLLHIVYDLKREFRDELNSRFSDGPIDTSNQKIIKAIEILEDYHMNLGGQPIP